MTSPESAGRSELPEGPARPARDAAEVASAVAVLISAFWDDPVWSWAFPDPQLREQQYALVWGMVAEESAGHGTLWVSEGSAAAWVPPGADEMSVPDAERLPDLLVEMIGKPAAEQVLGLWERFEDARPTEPHHYLSLLGTHRSRRGYGLGMALLRETLREYDSSGVGCYLESSNPVNNARYASVGFERRGRIDVADGVPPITTMWRPAGLA
jgi:ribosomal protein S18 acetylase RimI-like enzyme